MQLTDFLEIVAGALHKRAGYDNQSTTTVAFCELNQTLYVTSQTTGVYSGVLGSNLDNFAGGHKKALNDQRFATFLDEAGAALKGRKRDDYDDFAGEIQSVKIIRDAELFVSTIDKTGLHGESRVIRYLLIKGLRGSAPTDALKAPSKSEREEFSTWRRDVMSRFEKRYSGHLSFGSSQGACQYCANYLSLFKLAYGSVQSASKNRDGTWRHPLTLTTAERSFGPPSANSFLATEVAAHHYNLKNPPSTGNDSKMETT